MIRFWNSIIAGIAAFRHPECVNANNLLAITDLYGMMFTVADSNRPLMSHVGFVEIETKENHVLVSVWAGPGIGCSPTLRIAELLKENEALKMMLSERELSKTSKISGKNE